MAHRTGVNPEGQATPGGLMMANPVRIAASPEAFSGDGDWHEWIAAFEICSRLSGWTDDVKLQRLQLRLTGAAGRVFRRLPESAVRSFDAAKVALAEVFEAPEQHLVHEMAFRSRRELVTESWSAHAEALLSLAEKAYPSLDGTAIDALVNVQLLQSIEDPQLQYLVRRAMPTTVAESVRELTVQQTLQSSLRRPSAVASAEEWGSPASIMDPVVSSEPGAVTEIESRLDNIEQSIRQLRQLVISNGTENVMAVNARRRMRNEPRERLRRRLQCWKCQGTLLVDARAIRETQEGHPQGPSGWPATTEGGPEPTHCKCNRCPAGIC
ncbi:hypothetical protein M513_11408 [Trichuris suis]|uniref:Uncharacterized protein n=1 Tax=Trichuris suis TaxID=68888 RepID=A0A085LRY4_9BILA|nr:hypothetical protein M513_11408 [Trichuris suis]